MLHLIQKARTDTSSSLSLTLTFEQRSKSRLRATLDDGQDVAVLLDRGEHLHAGDILQTKEGETVRVHAADERVSIVVCENTHLLARACYHLGNRHVALQIAPSELRYRHDHVLDEMLKLLGLSVKVCDASFEPEPGAYGAHAHGDSHDHHGHEH